MATKTIAPPKNMDLRSKKGREWKRAHPDYKPQNAAPKETRADGTTVMAAPPPSEALVRGAHKTEATLRTVAAQIRPHMPDALAIEVRDAVLKEADRLFKRLRMIEE